MAAFSGNKYYLLPFDLYQGFFKKMSTRAVVIETMSFMEFLCFTFCSAISGSSWMIALALAWFNFNPLLTKSNRHKKTKPRNFSFILTPPSLVSYLLNFIPTYS